MVFTSRCPRFTRYWLKNMLSAPGGRRITQEARYQQLTDGGPEFKAYFLTGLPAYCDRHRIARPYRKNEQSYIESFNRTVRKECLGWNKYRLRDLKESTHMGESFLQKYHYH